MGSTEESCKGMLSGRYSDVGGNRHIRPGAYTQAHAPPRPYTFRLAWPPSGKPVRDEANPRPPLFEIQGWARLICQLVRSCSFALRLVSDAAALEKTPPRPPPTKPKKRCAGSRSLTERPGCGTPARSNPPCTAPVLGPPSPPGPAPSSPATPPTSPPPPPPPALTAWSSR